MAWQPSHKVNCPTDSCRQFGSQSALNSPKLAKMAGGNFMKTLQLRKKTSVDSKYQNRCLRPSQPRHPFDLMSCDDSSFAIST